MKCSNCGKENAPGEGFCDECGCPLVGAVAPQRAPEAQPAAGDIKCPNTDCGAMNPVGTTFCIDCGADLSEAPSPAGAAQPAPAARGKLILSNNSEIVLADTTRTIGRGDLDRVVSSDDLKYISREHLRIDFENGAYYVEDHSSANGTKLNGTEIRGKGKQELKDGDRIEVAGVATLSFRVL